MVEIESSYVAKVIYLPKKSGERGWGARVSKKEYVHVINLPT